MFGTGNRTSDRSDAVTPLSVALSVGLHVLVIGVFLLVTQMVERMPETVVPIDMTIVPPWAQQTDDPEPDPNPPPREQPKPPQPKPAPPKPDIPKPVKDVEAVERVPQKPKKPDPPKKPEKLDLRSKATLVKDAPKPPEKLDLRDKATKVDAPRLPPGKGTAADKPLSPEEFRQKMLEGYRIGARNQLATSEAQRCVSLINAAVLKEWEKESFNWYPGLRKLTVTLRFGPGGSVRGFSIDSGSGDAEVDRTARSALGRLSSIPGLSATFLEQNSVFTFTMTPVSGN